MHAANATREKARICTNLDTTKEILIIIILNFLNIKNGINYVDHALWTKLYLKIKGILKGKNISPIDIFWWSTESSKNYFKKEISRTFSVTAALVE